MLPSLHEHKTPPPPFHLLLLPSQAFHMGQTSLRFRAFQCDSSSPPVCDGSNSSGLPTPGVVSPSLLLILGLVLEHTQRACQCQTWKLHAAVSPQLSTSKVLFFCCGDTHFLHDVKKPARAAVAFSRPSKSRICLGSVLVPFPKCSQHGMGSALVLDHSFCFTHKDKNHYMLRLIRACCAPSGSLPQEQQKKHFQEKKSQGFLLREKCIKVLDLRL